MFPCGVSILTIRSGHRAFRPVLTLASYSGRLAIFRLGLAEYDCKVEHQPDTTQKVGDGVSGICRSKEKQDFVDDEVPCFVTESNPDGIAAHLDHREAVKAFWDSNGTKSQKEHTILSTVLDVEKDPVTPVSSDWRSFRKPE